MTSNVTICNAALGRLGDNLITTITGPEKAAKLCAVLYEPLRDRLLRRFQPNFARVRVVLARLSTAPAFTWSAQFQLPADCLRILQVGQEGTRESYLLEGRRILANVTSLPILYVSRATDEQTWDSQFVDLMQTALAAQLAYPITKSPPMRDALMAEFQQMRKEMGAVNGQEQEPDDMPDSTIQTARF